MSPVRCAGYTGTGDFSGANCKVRPKFRVVARSKILGYSPNVSHSCGRHLAWLVSGKFEDGARNPVEVFRLEDEEAGGPKP